MKFLSLTYVSLLLLSLSYMHLHTSPPLFIFSFSFHQFFFPWPSDSLLNVYFILCLLVPYYTLLLLPYTTYIFYRYFAFPTSPLAPAVTHYTRATTSYSTARHNIITWRYMKQICSRMGCRLHSYTTFNSIYSKTEVSGYEVILVYFKRQSERT